MVDTQSHPLVIDPQFASSSPTIYQRPHPLMTKTHDTDTGPVAHKKLSAPLVQPSDCR